MIKLIAQIIFYGLVGIFTLYSMMMVYILLRYGRSKVLGLVMSGLYLVLVITLYAAAVGNFIRIVFPEFSFSP